jgi:hypothetical protein
MSLVEIRARALEQVDWAPTQSAEFLALFDRMINRAYNALFTDAPFLLERDVRIVTQPDARPVTTEATDVMAVNTTDRRVLERARTTTFPTYTGTQWATNKTWDGRWVEVTDPNGQVHRRRTREWWTDVVAGQGGGLVYYDRVSLEEPWPNNTDTNMLYRVYTPEYALPSEVGEIKSARFYGDSNHRLEVANQYDMERYQLADFQGRIIGMPELVYRGQPFQLMAPTRAPDVVLPDLPAWAGPENPGSFDFLFTYVWGNKDPDLITPLGLDEPRWESAPSPVSARIATGGATAINIYTPNVDFELGFRTGLVSENRSGMRKRIYVRRYTSITNGTYTSRIESPEVFMLLAELPGNTETLTWTGSIQPDYLRRFRRIGSQQSIIFYPMPDARYEIDLRVQYRPDALINGQDAARLNDDATDALVQKVLAFFYTYDGKPELGQMAEASYQDRLRTLTKRYGIIAYAQPKKLPARVGHGVSGYPSKQARYIPPT